MLSELPPKTSSEISSKAGFNQEKERNISIQTCAHKKYLKFDLTVKFKQPFYSTETNSFITVTCIFFSFVPVIKDQAGSFNIDYVLVFV